MSTGVIDVVVTNRTARLVSEYPEKQLMPYWSFAHPKWFFIRKKYRYWDRKKNDWVYWWDGTVRYLKDSGVLPAGLFWATKNSIEQEQGIKFKITGRLKAPEWKTKGVIDSEREYQQVCVEKMVKTSRFGGGLILSATGSGKTWIAGMYLSRIAGCGVFVVDQLTLLAQAKKELEEVMGEPIGEIGDGVFDPRRITVATVQTLHLHRKDRRFQGWYQSLDVMLIDEIHEQMNYRNFKVVEKIMPMTVFGLTATIQMKKKPIRTKAWSLAGPIVFEFPLEEGQKQGVLTRGVAVQVRVPNPMSKKAQKTLGWQFWYDRAIVDSDLRNYVIERIVRRGHARGKYTIVLVSRLAHLWRLSRQLEDIPHKVVAGKTKKNKVMEVEQRMVAKQEFEAGELRLLIANTVFKKGVDIKRVDVIVDGAAGRNANDPIQKYGRGVRRHRDKSGLLYFDIYDTDEENAKNYFLTAARSRDRALKRAGITVKSFQWGVEGKSKELFERAERWLQKELLKQQER